MKISLGKEDIKKFDNYLKALDETISEADYFNDILFNDPIITSKNHPYKISRLDPKEYSSNPYYQVIKPHGEKKGKVLLDYDKYLPKQGFVYDEIKLKGEHFQEETPFGYFEDEFKFLALKEDDRTWMSVTPHEINTMKQNVAEAKGNVITLGLGLGYYAFMVSIKDDVNKVTIVEMNNKIIDIFKEEILPLFPHKEKIEIINEDAFVFLEKDFDGDYLFADLWHMPDDGLPMYAKIAKTEKKHPKTKYAYWIENSILALLRRAIIILMSEEIEGSNDENYSSEETFSDHLINQLHFILKDIEINNTKDINNLLSFASLKNLALRIHF